jgi:competence ComEA-like helix-hairpin-helix protein
MPGPELRTLLLLVALAVAGQGIRYLVTEPDEPPGQVQLLSTLSPGSPSAQRERAVRQARPLAPGEQIDVDVAPIGELARLPKVGVGLAKTIVADREAHGAFGNLQGLDRVPGVGPGLLKTLAPRVVFSGAGAPSLDGSGQAPLNINSATLSQLDSLPGIGPAKAAAILRYREERGRFQSVEDLARVPGFGPALVARLRERVSVP